MSDEIPDFQSTLAQANRKKMAKPKLVTRLLKLALLLIVLGFATWGYMKFEARWITVDSIDLPNETFPVRRSFRILHLSDFHFSDNVPLSYIEESIVLGLRKKADVCFITGDFITTKISDDDFAKYVKVLGKLTEKVPTFACLGNHDGGKWSNSANGYSNTERVEELLQEAKIGLLENERRVIYVKGQPLALVGLGDIWNQRCFPDKCLRKKSEGGSAQNPPTIILSHNPDSKAFLSEHEWNLMLCGHTHGGQCKIPFLGYAPFAPVKDHDYLEGLHTWEDRLIHISRGVGNLHGLRFNCRPQVCILEAKAP